LKPKNLAFKSSLFLTSLRERFEANRVGSKNPYFTKEYACFPGEGEEIYLGSLSNQINESFKDSVFEAFFSLLLLFGVDVCRLQF
jgi:hypothetical protein